MKRHRQIFKLVIIILLFSGCSVPEQSGINYIEIAKDDSASEIIFKAAHVVPSEQQIKWQELEFTCFICLGINTFTNREWGTGKEDSSCHREIVGIGLPFDHTVSCALICS